MAFRLAQLDVPAALAYGRDRRDILGEQPPSFGTAAETPLKPAKFAGDSLASAIGQAGLNGVFGREASGAEDPKAVEHFQQWITRYRSGGLDPMRREQQQSSEEMA